jgi:hypothetical protein
MPDSDPAGAKAAATQNQILQMAPLGLGSQRAGKPLSWLGGVVPDDAVLDRGRAVVFRLDPVNRRDLVVYRHFRSLSEFLLFKPLTEDPGNSDPQKLQMLSPASASNRAVGFSMKTP